MCRAAFYLSTACSDVGSSFCVDGLDVLEELRCACVSAHPEMEEHGTLQGCGDEERCEWDDI